MQFDRTITIEDMIIKYLNKICVSTSIIEKNIIFIYHNEISKKTVRSLLVDNSSDSISVFDQAHLISLSIHFIATTGLKTVMEVERTKTIEDMIKEYVKKIGLSESSIGKEIIFIFCGKILDPKSKDNVGMILGHNSSITVFDQANMIYLSIHFNASNGFKTHMKMERTKTIEDVLKEYANKIGLSEETFEKECIFKYNDTKLATKSKESVGNILRNKSSINVVFESNEKYDKYFTITFESSSTKLKTIMTIKGTKTINEMMREYGNKVGVPEETIGKEIIFLQGKKILDANSRDIFESLYEINKSFIFTINAFDQTNRLGN